MFLYATFGSLSFLNTDSGLNFNHEDVRLVVVDEVALRHLEPVTIGLSLSSSLRCIRQLCFWDSVTGIPSFAQNNTGRMVELPAWAPRVTTLYSTPSPANSKHPRRRLSRFSDVAKSQTFSVQPTQAAARSFELMPPGSAAPSHLPRFPIVDIFSNGGLSTIYCQNILSIPRFPP
ncbi:hypothetical protein EDD85DRAFT_795052 [Armillaria nabsnona]|nr:hypothetical protein EDD85DRAFT_795052 [Armillaria nabsnona]